MPDGPVSGRHLDGEPYVPYTADDLRAQREDRTVAADPVIEPDRLTLFDVYGNALTARWLNGGVQVGGVLITDPEHAELLAKFITRESEDDA